MTAFFWLTWMYDKIKSGDKIIIHNKKREGEENKKDNAKNEKNLVDEEGRHGFFYMSAVKCGRMLLL